MKQLQKNELIGLMAEVYAAKNKDLLGICGRIVDETKNTIMIEQKNGDKKTILKDGILLKIFEGDQEYLLDCSQIIKRPYERIKK